MNTFTPPPRWRTLSALLDFLHWPLRNHNPCLKAIPILTFMVIIFLLCSTVYLSLHPFIIWFSFACIWTLHKWNHQLCILLCLAPFKQTLYLCDSSMLLYVIFRFHTKIDVNFHWFFFFLRWARFYIWHHRVPLAALLWQSYFQKWWLHFHHLHGFQSGFGEVLSQISTRYRTLLLIA